MCSVWCAHMYRIHCMPCTPFRVLTWCTEFRLFTWCTVYGVLTYTVYGLFPLTVCVVLTSQFMVCWHVQCMVCWHHSLWCVDLCSVWCVDITVYGVLTCTVYGVLTCTVYGVLTCTVYGALTSKFMVCWHHSLRVVTRCMLAVVIQRTNRSTAWPEPCLPYLSLSTRVHNTGYPLYPIWAWVTRCPQPTSVGLSPPSWTTWLRVPRGVGWELYRAWPIRCRRPSTPTSYRPTSAGEAWRGAGLLWATGCVGVVVANLSVGHRVCGCLCC